MSLFFGRKKKTDPVPVSKTGNIVVGRGLPGRLVLKISGVVTPEAVAETQRKVIETAGQGAPVTQGLFDAREFQGWAPGFDGGMSDIEKMMAIDRIFERIAVIADEGWHESLALFMGAWARKAQIKFFAPRDKEKALTWLEGR